MQSKWLLTTLAAAVAGFGALAANSGALGEKSSDKLTPITEKIYHLGNGEKPEWMRFSTARPAHRLSLRLHFDAAPLDGRASTLELLSGDVGESWKLRLNEKEIGELKKGAEPQRQFFEVPAGLLRAGQNDLLIECKNDKSEDDIYVGRITLHRLSLKELQVGATIRVEVVDARSGAGLPCRLTLTQSPELLIRGEPEEVLADFQAGKHSRWALRKGIFYTLDGKAELKAMPGRYRLYATRGFEYSLARTTVNVEAGEERSIRLKIEREVNTDGYLASDTHIHTRTYSGHGDATVEERVVTIAGEGVEVAIATDHDHHTDYRPAIKETGAQNQFFPIVGNEFTTAIGHFNAFPVDKDAKPAKHDHKDWVKLIQGLRDTPGVRVVIVNHPRRSTFTDSPFGYIGLNPLSGEVHHGPADLGIDAVEVLNGRTLASNKMLTFEDWFGLLNRGYKVAAVAGSDSHTVDGIVGQARTYIRCRSDDPDRADLQEICDSFLKGRLLVSLGLLADIKVNGKFEPGDLATNIKDEVGIEITVTGPRWTRATEVALFVNGQEVRKEPIKRLRGVVVKYHDTWKIPAPRHDAFVVVIASGPPVSGPYWSIWQRNKYVCGATNPVWIDGDGDGKFTCAHDYATQLIQKFGSRPAEFQEALAGYDDAVAIQIASLVRAEALASLQADYERLREKYIGQMESALGKAKLGKDSPIIKYLMSTPSLDIIASFAKWERALEEKFRKLEKDAESKTDPEDRVDLEEKDQDLRKREDL